MIILIKNSALAASLIHNECSDQEREHFCEQYWKIFANEIFLILSMKILSYLEMEKNVISFFI